MGRYCIDNYYWLVTWGERKYSSTLLEGHLWHKSYAMYCQAITRMFIGRTWTMVASSNWTGKEVLFSWHSECSGTSCPLSVLTVLRFKHILWRCWVKLNNGGFNTMWLGPSGVKCYSKIHCTNTTSFSLIHIIMILVKEKRNLVWLCCYFNFTSVILYLSDKKDSSLMLKCHLCNNNC